MKLLLSRAEKRLAGALVLLFVLSGVFLGWKRASAPLLVETQLPVMQAQFLTSDRLLIITQSPSRGSRTFPVVVLSGTSNAQKRVSRVWDFQIDLYKSHVSPDGRYWLVGEYELDSSAQKLVLYDLRTLTKVRTFDSNGGSWLDSRRLSIWVKPNTQIWNISDGGELTLQSQKAGLTRNPIISPNSKTELRFVEQKTRVLEESPDSPKLQPRDFYRSQTVVVTIPGEKPFWRLPGDSWSRLSWQKNGTQLWGLAFVSEVFPQRGDIMRFDLASRKTSATQLQVPDDIGSDNLSLWTFGFSKDGRFLMAATNDGALFLWDAATGRFLHAFLPTKEDSYHRAPLPTFSGDSRFLLRPTRRGVEVHRTEQFVPRS